MAIEIKLQAFEGPLDLLLHLIDKNKVNIYDIPIALITGQYMEYLSAMQEEETQLDTMSEFLVMAATLLDIKSRMLLPAEKDEAGEEIDPRDELVRQLLEYKMYKYMSFEQAEYPERSGLLPGTRERRRGAGQSGSDPSWTIQNFPGGHEAAGGSEGSHPFLLRQN